MTRRLVPASEAEACDMIRAAAASATPLAIEGGGTKREMGRPMAGHDVLGADGLAGITVYHPQEMVISARAGTPLAMVEAVLAEKGQRLAFEPIDYRALLGSTGTPTIGAIAAINNSGPRRIVAGAARDSLLGVRFVNGSGEAIRNGGRVMKNVTGLDLVKLVCGAHGTLGAITEVTFRLLPKPERAGTLVIEGLDDARAIHAMSAALASPFEVSGAAHLPGQQARTLMRVEHFASSVEYRLGELAKLLTRFGKVCAVEDEEAPALWRGIRDCAPLAGPVHPAIWRASLPPSRAAAFVADVATTGALRDWFYDWGGGLVWLATGAEAIDTGAVHSAAASAKGHATLMRATDEARARATVFQPQEPALLELTARVKASFDPDRILNPGRMYAGV